MFVVKRLFLYLYVRKLIYETFLTVNEMLTHHRHRALGAELNTRLVYD